MGILEKADSDTLTVLEGNSGNSVCRSTYLTTDGTICGYGSLNDAFGRYQQAQNSETPETPAPDAEGTESPEASAEPTPEPSEAPSIEPSLEPSVEPSIEPSVEPSLEPSVEPSASPEASPEASEEPAEPEETEETPEPVPPLTAAEKLAALIDSLNEELPGDSEEANDRVENGENGAGAGNVIRGALERGVGSGASRAKRGKRFLGGIRRAAGQIDRTAARRRIPGLRDPAGNRRKPAQPGGGRGNR